MKKIFLGSYLLWMTIFILIPIILIGYYAFCQNDNGIIFFTLENLRRAFKLIYIKVLLRSINLALICTLICLLIGYPVAYIMADKHFHFSSMLLFLFLVPMWMNMLLRTYAWLSILEQNGIVNSFLAMIGLPKLNLLYTNQTIVLGMVYNFLPFMILPIHTCLKKINYSTIEAAQDLGANSFTIFCKIIFPLSMPGILSGITMVFMPAVTSFIVPNLLGGGKFMLIGNLIEQQFLRTSDWNFGCAVSLILILIIFACAIVFSLIDNQDEGGNLF